MTSEMIRKAARFVFVNTLSADLLRDDTEIKTIKRLFKSYVKLVEIENHSYCNRVCWFCPNAELDRRSEVVPMDLAVYRRILDSLAEIDYSETLVWARYHEPMAHESIYANLALARTSLPRAFLTMHTNGDYINRKTIVELTSAGLNQLRVNLYVANGQEYTSASVEKMIRQLEDRSGLKVESVEGGGRKLVGSTIDMPVNVPNFGNGMSSRGGLLVQIAKLEQYSRKSVCLSPIQHVVVDYNGKGVLCCQTRSDASEHADACIGDLSSPNYGLFEFYRDLGKARSGLVVGGPKHGVCATCTVNEGGPNNIGRVQPVAGALGLFSRLTERAWTMRGRRYDPNV